MTEIDRRAWDPFAPAPTALTGVVHPMTDQDTHTTTLGDLPEDLDDLRKADLIALADKRDLDTTGTRAELIARLRGQD